VWMDKEKSRPASYAGAAVIVAIWLGVLYWIARRYGWIGA
jgi:lysozyme family protein